MHLHFEDLKVIKVVGSHPIVQTVNIILQQHHVILSTWLEA